MLYFAHALLMFIRIVASVACDYTKSVLSTEYMACLVVIFG